MNLKQLLGICEHEWEWVNQVRLVDEYGQNVGTKVHLWCTRCGEAKSERL